MPTPLKTLTADSLRVRVYADADQLAQAAAREAQACLQQALVAQGHATVVLATGNSQIQFLQELARLGQLDWSRVTCFHMDEYLGLSADHPASFRRYLRQRVEERVHPRAFHYLDGTGLQPIQECDRYARLLAVRPADLCCLGIGENGHLAFNDPAVAEFEDSRSVKIVKLDDACRQQQVGEGHFATLEAVPQYALTVTIPALCAARKMLCLCPERRKAAAVKAALQGPVATACPASFLRRQSHAILFLDAESASLL